MKSKNNRYSFLFVLFCLFLSSIAVQGEYPDKLHLKVHIGEDRVILRWAPSDYGTWQKGNKYGYRVEKILISRNGIISDYKTRQTVQVANVRALEEKNWELLVKKDSAWAPVALQCLWGETFELTTSFRSNIMETYNKVKENDSRFGFALYCADRSLSVASALGLSCEDRIKDKREKYIYRVYINAPLGEKSDTAYAVVHNHRVSEYTKPSKPTASVFERKFLLSWSCESTDYVGYYVERSFDGRSYRRVGDRLVVPVGDGSKLVGYFADSITGNQTNISYRIVGLTPFLVEGPFSDTLKVDIKSSITSPTSVEVTLGLSGAAIVKWKYNAKEKNLSHFKIERSGTIDTGYSILADKIKPDQRRWQGKLPAADGYYRVVAVSVRGDEGKSLVSYMPLNDSIPPSPPIGLSGTIDSSGTVTLKWQKNVEPDLLGYRIFRANGTKSEYTQLSTRVDSLCWFKDKVSLNTLSSYVFYKLAAVDKRYNTSGYSLALRLKIPDIIKPAPPVIKEGKSENGITEIHWEPSVSHDVAAYLIYRRGSRDSVLVASLPSLVSNFKDTSSNEVGLCYYWMAAVDSSGNRSTVSNRYAISHSRKEIDAEIALYGRMVIEMDRPVVSLSWNSPGSSPVLLYKKKDGQFILLKKFDSGETGFKEQFVQNTTVEYFIKTKDMQGKDVVSKLIKVE